MTREEFLKEIDKLDDTHYLNIWNEEVSRLGEKRAIEIYGGIEGVKKHALDNYINNRANAVQADIDIIRIYNDTFREIGEKEFVESFGEFELFLLNNAIERQKKGIKGYI